MMRGGISEKNSTYCELTALYWIWKNDKSDIVGFEHYRRFFMRFGRYITAFLSPKIAEKKLRKYDIILPNCRKCTDTYGCSGYTVYEQYALWHHIEDLNCCYSVLKEKYPAYLEAFEQVMKQHQMISCNMFVMKREPLNQYCQWLFDVLAEVENRVDISGYDSFQKRIFGFLGERLLDVWVKKNDMKVYHAYVSNIEWRPTFSQKIKQIVNGFFDRAK